MKVKDLVSVTGIRSMAAVAAISATALVALIGAGFLPMTAARAVPVSAFQQTHMGAASAWQATPASAAPRLIRVPSVAGVSGATAVRRLKAIGVKTAVVPVVSSTVKPYLVVSNTMVGKRVRPGSVVTVYASIGTGIQPLSSWRTAKVSWYGPGFYGNTMAGGGRLTTSSMVVAHKTMKFGTKLQFSYKGRTCTAVVKDRGPYVSGRTFDLGPGTAKALGFGGVGTVSYRIVK